MKVKIVKCSSPTFWYSDRIGEEFEVEKTKEKVVRYKVTRSSGCIEVEDCEIVEEYCWGEEVEVKDEENQKWVDGWFYLFSDEKGCWCNQMTQPDDVAFRYNHIRKIDPKRKALREELVELEERAKEIKKQLNK